MADSQTGTYALKVGRVHEMRFVCRCYQNRHDSNIVRGAGWFGTDAEGWSDYGRNHS